MTTTTTSYQVDGNLERKHVNSKNSTIDIVENENKITSLTNDIDQNSQGKKINQKGSVGTFRSIGAVSCIIGIWPRQCIHCTFAASSTVS